MTMTIRILGASLALTLGAAASTVAHAAPLSNGGFSAGLTGWTTTGNVSVQPLLAGPAPSGNPVQALISNVSVLPTYALGTVPAESGTNLAGALGLGAGVLDGLKRAGDTGNVVFGSALAQTFTAGAGDVLSFNWNYLTDESSNPLGNDYAFVVLDGVATKLADTFTLQKPTVSVFTYETGFTSFSRTLTAGNHTLAIGVVDVNDALGSSAVLVDRVAVNVVPEPGSLSMLLGGIAALAWFRGRAHRCS